MTAQQYDTVVYEGTTFALLSHGAGLFDPASLGVLPRPLHTANWRGYHCEYTARDGTLQLDRVDLGLPMPALGEDEAAAPTLFGQQPVVDRGTARYTELRGAMPYTGTLLLGADFIQAHYVHMGYQDAWKFGRVLQLTLTDGRVDAVEDRSASYAQMREEAAAGRDPLRPRPPTPPPSPGVLSRLSSWLRGSQR